MPWWLCQCFPCFSSAAPLLLISSSAEVLGGDGHSGVFQWKWEQTPYPTFLSGERGEQRSAPAALLGALSLQGPCDTAQPWGQVGVKHSESRESLCHGSVSPVMCQAGQQSVATRVCMAGAQGGGAG